MERCSKCPIEIRRKRSAEHHAQIAAVRPVGLTTHLVRNELEKLRARKRIRDRYSDVVRLGLPHHPNGCLNFFPTLAGVSELEKETTSNTASCQVLASCVDFFHLKAFIHRIQNTLSSRFCSHPDLAASGSLQG